MRESRGLPDERAEYRFSGPGDWLRTSCKTMTNFRVKLLVFVTLSLGTPWMTLLLRPSHSMIWPPSKPCRNLDSANCWMTFVAQSGSCKRRFGFVT